MALTVTAMSVRMFNPHSERELPLAQWTYELVLEGLMRVELNNWELYSAMAQDTSRWRHPLRRKRYIRLGWEALECFDAYNTELIGQRKEKR